MHSDRKNNTLTITSLAEDSTERDLLEDYASIMRSRGPKATARTVLRQRSSALRDAMVYTATEGAHRTLPDLLRNLETPAVRGFDEKWVAYLAYAVALGARDEGDLRDALSLYSTLRPATISSFLIHAKVYVELLMSLGRNSEAREFIVANASLREIEDDYLYTDSLNPFVPNAIGRLEEWWPRFQQRFTNQGLEAPVLTGAHEITVFDQLDSPALPTIETGPLVTVIMTCYRPDHALRTAVDSILKQTWRNLELLIVDDGSPAEYEAILQDVQSLDERIRLLRLRENVGTYAARNAGLRQASGEFITGNDSDDWSHPRRIELQVAPMLNDGTITNTVSRAITVSENLLNFRVGNKPSKVNVSSLMVRRTVLKLVGEYDSSRKAADSEFMERVAHASAPTHVVELPLALIRVKSNSLSRSDFGPFWRHEARRSYVTGYRWWHASSDMRIEARLPQEPRPFPLPSSYQIKRRRHESYDVIFASEWRRYGGPQKSMIEEIRALTSAGYRVAICQMYAARFISIADGKHCAPIQAMLNSGEVEEVYLDDPLVARLLIVRYPPVLQFLPDAPTRWKVERLIVLANQAPAERDGTDVRYRVSDCHRNSAEYFECEPLWVPQGPTVRGAISEEVADGNLATFDMPGILSHDDWWTERKSFRSTRPVIGRHSRDDPMKWPGERSVLEAVYPSNPEFDVRVMGGVRSLSRMFPDWTPPPNWLVFPRDYVDVRTFLNSIDFFVYFQNNKAYDAFGRATLEAIASGCVAILPHHLEPTFGPAGIYCDPSDVSEIVRQLHGDLSRYLAHSARAVEHVKQTFSHSSYVRRVDDLLQLENLVV